VVVVLVAEGVVVVVVVVVVVTVDVVVRSALFELHPANKATSAADEARATRRFDARR